MSKSNIDVKDNFDYFNELVYSEKNIEDEKILLLPKRNNRDWLINKTNVQHSTIDDEIVLIIEQKISLYKYGIKLHCSDFTEKPYFRFDSDGPAHRNTSKYPLSEQLVTTPHFNTFDEEGEEFAYKNDVLKKDEEAKAISENIDFGVSLFFQEANIKTKQKDEYPEIMNDQLFDFDVESDPLKGIDF